MFGMIGTNGIFSHRRFRHVDDAVGAHPDRLETHVTPQIYPDSFTSSMVRFGGWRIHLRLLCT